MQSIHDHEVREYTYIKVLIVMHYKAYNVW